jgi:hypothetical protein
MHHACKYFIFCPDSAYRYATNYEQREPFVCMYIWVITQTTATRSCRAPTRRASTTARRTITRISKRTARRASTTQTAAVECPVHELMMTGVQPPAGTASNVLRHSEMAWSDFTACYNLYVTRYRYSYKDVMMLPYSLYLFFWRRTYSLS